MVLFGVYIEEFYEESFFSSPHYTFQMRQGKTMFWTTYKVNSRTSLPYHRLDFAIMVTYL